MSLSSHPEVVPIYLPFVQRTALSELNIVSIDHCYAKPWSTHPEASNARAACLLFMNPCSRQSNEDKVTGNIELIDVDSQESPAMPDYDVSNARTMMSECERHAALLRPEYAEAKDDWEEHIASIRTTWTALQNRLFAKVMRVLQADRLSRLTIQDTKNEPIQRRLQINKAAKRVKFAFANVNWDMPLILWLHNLFLENLRGQLLTSYLEILQTLKVKIPSLVECLIEGTVCKPGGLASDSLNVLLKRTWDPVLSSINQQKPKKLPGQSLLLVISNAPFVASSPLAAKRHKFWQHQLNFMGKVFNVVPVNNSTAISVANCVENMVASARSKILEVKGQFPKRPIILIGFHIGSLVACQVALMEQVQAVVCLGYPTMGVRGNRFEIDDPVYNYKTPTLFVVGQHASSCSVDDLEDIREKLRVESGLVVVGGADDHLRMCRARKKRCGVTQSVVDRCVIDEVTNFLGNTLQLELSSSDYLDDVDIVKKSPRKRKQKQALVVAVGSQTSDLEKQKSAKALKSLKQDPMLSSVSASIDSSILSKVSSPSLPLPKVSKTGKRNSPKKHSTKVFDSEPSSKKTLIQTNTKASAVKRSLGQSSLSSRSEAAVIASAPELSNLLQSMKTDLTRLSTSQPSATPSATSISTLPSTLVPSSIQTTTAFTLSKFLLSSDIFKSSDNLVDSSDTSLDSQVDNNELKKASLSENLPQSSDNVKKPETQILIHTRGSAVPISFPVTFTLASKVKTTTPLMKAATAAQHIPSFAYQNKSVPQSQTSGIQVVQSTSTVLSSTLPPTSISSSKTLTSFMKDSTPAAKSPLASVIDIGNDTVQMKETLPSTTAPGTVSIDLGQLSASNNIVMKFSNPSKISLMPTLRTVSSSLLNSEKRDITVASILREEKSSTNTSQPKSVAINTTGKPLEKNLKILSSSDLLSSLSSNTGLITLKLATPTNSTVLSVPQKVTEKCDRNESSIKPLTVSGFTTPRNVTAMTFNPSTSSIGSMVAKPILSHPLLKDHREKADSKSLSTSEPIFLTTATNPSLSSVNLSSSLLTLHSANSSVGSIPKTTLPVEKTETLGKVSSLLESSPVTVERPKPTPITLIKTPSATDPSPESSNKVSTKSRLQSVSSPVTSSQPTTGRLSKSTVASYTPTTKQVLPTVASTRTRRIKTPKQYDL